MYTVHLTDDEIATLGWLSDRGYFPDEAYDNLSLADNQAEEVASHIERVWELEEHAAWSITDLLNEDPGAYLACCGSPLYEKITHLTNQIV